MMEQICLIKCLVSFVWGSKMEKYKIQEIPYVEQESYEQLGTKEKFWLNNRQSLFKSGRENTLEDCSEKIAYEIAKLIDLPCAKYEFGKFITPQNQVRFGVVSENFLKHKENEALVLGNQILGKIFKDYDQYSRYKARKYTPALVLLTFETLSELMRDYSFLQTFIGYLVFDCLIGNTDRHHENWGIIVNGGFRIAPSFDHASGLASKVGEREAQERLQTKDRGRSIEYFCQKAKSAFWKGGKQLKTIEVCEEIESFEKSRKSMRAQKIWIEKIAQLHQLEFERILDNIPLEMGMKDSQKDFILKVLQINTNRLKELIKEKK